MGGRNLGGEKGPAADRSAGVCMGGVCVCGCVGAVYGWCVWVEWEVGILVNRREQEELIVQQVDEWSVCVWCLGGLVVVVRVCGCVGGVGGRNQGGQEVFPDGMFMVKEVGV